jgi:hypothetical protein
MLRLCFCLALQFSQVLEDPSGPAYLHKYVDPALNGDYPVDSMWKVRSCGTSNSNLSHGLMSVSRVRADLFCLPKAHHPAFEITQRMPGLCALNDPIISHEHYQHLHVCFIPTSFRIGTQVHS